MNADVLAAQDVEDLVTPTRFDREELDGLSDRLVMLAKGGDPRLIDVGVLSRPPIAAATVVADETVSRCSAGPVGGADPRGVLAGGGRRWRDRSCQTSTGRPSAASSCRRRPGSRLGLVPGDLGAQGLRLGQPTSVVRVEDPSEPLLDVRRNLPRRRIVPFADTPCGRKPAARSSCADVRSCRWSRSCRGGRVPMVGEGGGHRLA
jgi:hypothetical protein